ncbi:hypothetical protein [Azospirillum agricola]|nr:hypothetical protein [Azospirillum agricola]SMH60427.1 hypothetical protein SAMN02982994_5495 [Azospirillum lipoferum]
MDAVVNRIGRKKLGLLLAAIGAAILDQVAGTNLLPTVLSALVGG